MKQQQQQSTRRRRASVMLLTYLTILMLIGCWTATTDAFVMPTTPTNACCYRVHHQQQQQRLAAETASASSTSQSDEDSNNDPNEIVARRIMVEGDVQGGYYRSCVLNEAGRFRRLTGTMSPPDDSKTAEIYVEGKRKMVDGFVRWCKKSNVGLSQVVTVTEVIDADPTGLYDAFYCKTR